jgi:hypothetical protein
MKPFDSLGRRGGIVVASAVTVAVIAGTAVGAVMSADKGSSSALVPFDPAPTESAAEQTPSATPSATPSPTPSATPSPTPKPTPTATPSPTPQPVVTPTASPSPTPKPLPTAPVVPTPRDGMAFVVIKNTSTVGAKVTINGDTWTVASGAQRTVEAKAPGEGHDEVVVTDMEHEGCGMGDSMWYLEEGKTFTLSITPSKNCIQDGKKVDSLTWSMSPEVKH